MRVVLDTNVLVSFLLTKGEVTELIIKGWETLLYTLLVSPETIQEVDQVVSRFVEQGLVGNEEARALIRRLRKNTVKVAVRSEISASVDRADNKFLACAKDGGADFLVSGDKKHLLSLKKFGKTRIVSPREFSDHLKQQSN